MESQRPENNLNNYVRSNGTSDFVVLAEGQTSQYFIHQLHQRLPKSSIKVFVKYSVFKQPTDIERLSGLADTNLLSKEAWEKTADNSNITFYWNSYLKKIHADDHTVVDHNNTEHAYKKLIIANNALPKKLNINNLDSPNILSISNNGDILQLLHKVDEKKNIVIIGGGLFGIEAAKLCIEQNHQVVCVEHNSRILFEHLDDHASAYLVAHLEKHNIRIKVQERISTIDHHSSTSSLELANGETIECDYIVLATGAKPDTKLAIESGIQIDRGIIINDLLETSQRDIYAIGENVEHRGKINRLLMNGTEQASILANRLAGTDSTYVGSLAFSRFTIFNYPVLSMGENGDYSLQHQQVIFRDTRQNIYRKIILDKSYITGVVALGDWEKCDSVKDALRYKKRILPWQIQQFKKHGELSNKRIVKAELCQPALNRVVTSYLPDLQMETAEGKKKPLELLLNYWSIGALSVSAAVAVFLMLPPIP